jgi:hypothetical protein
MLQVGISALALVVAGRGAWNEILASQFLSLGAVLFYALVGLVVLSFIWMMRSNQEGQIREAPPRDSEIATLRQQQAVREFVANELAGHAPAYRAELEEERRRSERLERRINELVEQNKRARKLAEETERSSAIRAELQRIGVAKVELAYRCVQQDVRRNEDGRFVGGEPGEEAPLQTFLAQFLNGNPEFLKAPRCADRTARDQNRKTRGQQSVDA